MSGCRNFARQIFLSASQSDILENMIKRICSVLLLAICYLSVKSQEKNIISGKIVDRQSHPVEAATVSILNSNWNTISDSQGDFSFRNIPSGQYTVQVTAIGFAAVSRDVSVGAGSTGSLVIQLSDASTQLDAVVVTAQKKEESLQKIPFSITAISSRKVEQFRLWNSKDLTAIVPNLYSANPGDDRNVTSIRGITSTSYDPAVATYIDGVNQFGLDTYIASLFDVERIEVLRGPQGTLYGRNAMGGVINIITKQPSNNTNGFAEINFGNYGQQRYSAGIRSPLVKDKLFLGAAAMYDHSDGYYTNEFNNSKFDRQHSITGNYYLKYLANDHWVVSLNVKHHDNRNNGTFPLVVGADAALANPFRLNQNAITQMIDNTLNSSLSINYAGHFFNFSSQTAYQSNHRYYDQPIDGDFSPIDGVEIINNYGNQWNRVRVYTQEFKFSSPASSLSPVKWTAGTYLFYQDNPVKQATRFGKDAAFVGAPDSLFSIINTTKGKSTGIAFYGQANYTLNEKFDLTFGLRYDYEHKKQSVRGQYQHDPNPDPIFDTRPDTSGTAGFSALSPKLGLEYHVANNHDLYFTYGRGYRAGGLTQLSSDPSQPPLFRFKPEYSNNFEVGIKNRSLNNILRINLSAFYTNITNAQVPTLILPDAITITRNTGKLNSKGVELELASTPLKGLEAEYNFGYNDAKYKTLKLSQNGTEVDLNGKRQIFSPSVTSMLALQYSYTISKQQDLKLQLRGEWMYIGDQYFDLANNIKQEGYNLFNTRFGIVARNFEIMFWGRNLADKKYIAYAYDFGAVHLGNPKTYGVTIKARI
jgi:iron complex outermembrane receptor protein